MEVSSIRVVNLRSLADTTHLDLKPINILVGRNSSGKSTFARVFPLMKQSSEVSKKGPLLWWGRLVDYGSFSCALNRDAQVKEMIFGFKFKFKPDAIKNFFYSREVSLGRSLKAGEIFVDIGVRDGGDDFGAYVSTVSFRPFGIACEIKLNQAGFIQEIMTEHFQWKGGANGNYGVARQNRLIPSIDYYRVIQKEGKTDLQEVRPFHSDLVKAVEEFVHGKTSEEKIQKLMRSINLGSYEDMYSSLIRITDPPTFREKLSQRGVTSREFRRLCDVFLVSNLDKFLDEIYSELTDFSRGVIYLEPLRATAQRYYRQQALSVDEIDSKGENIAMFFANLLESQLDDFNGWASKYFGIRVIPKREGGHISLTIQHEGSDTATNIADMGFGYSQLLPIAAQIWAAGYKYWGVFPSTGKQTSKLMVIEQPELHLHPQYQARLADIFAAATAEGDGSQDEPGLRIIAETHSSSLINRLGELVAKGVLKRDDIQVILFEQDASSSSAGIRKSSFNEDGILQNWPYGFFEPRR